MNQPVLPKEQPAPRRPAGPTSATPNPGPIPAGSGGSAGARAYRRLREGILTGEFAPGAFIEEQVACEATGVSRTPVREALARLGQDPAFDRTVPGRRIVLVSDMLQNSDVFSVYGRRRGDFADRVPPPEAVATAIRDTYGDSLRGVQLEIRLIPRPSWEAEQHGVLQVYWSEVFRRLGVNAYWLDI